MLICNFHLKVWIGVKMKNLMDNNISALNYESIWILHPKLREHLQMCTIDLDFNLDI